MENYDENKVSETKQSQSKAEDPKKIVRYYYWFLTFLAVDVLAVLSLCNIIAINPAWFSLPICLRSMYCHFSFLRILYRSQQTNSSLTEYYVKKLKDND